MHLHIDPSLSALAGLAAWCGAPAESIPVLLFLTGLIGGVGHCGPMCGPLVLAQAAGLPGASSNTAGPPILRRLAGGLLLPYHLGRLSTYAALGALAGTFGLAVMALTQVRLALALLLLCAAMLFAGQAIGRLAPGLATTWGAPVAFGGAQRLARLCRPLLGNPSPAGRFALGAVLGLLPCGFLYGALAAAAATGDPADGALAMAAFGLGTVPSLAAVGLCGAAAAARWRAVARRALAPLFLVNAVALTAMALAIAAAP